MSAGRFRLGGGWTLWKHAIVRGAGFPFSRMEGALRDPTGNRLWTIARDPLFREAVTWQNRPAVVTGLDALLRRPVGTNDAKTRKKKRLVVKYLQRYCAKNDTIGFFGPVGWATIGGDGSVDFPVEVTSRRRTYFEPWAILAIAQSIPMGPRRMTATVTLPGHLRLAGDRLIGPSIEIPLDAHQARLIRGIDGSSAATLLGRLSSTPEIQLRWLGVLLRLAQLGLVRWEYPVVVAHEPACQLIQLEPTECLQRMYALLDCVSAAAGCDVSLQRALDTLGVEFSKQTQLPPRRHEGRWYAGRDLVYEECRRSIRLDFGTQVIDQIAPALRILLKIARWYTYQIARALAKRLQTEFSESGSVRIGLHRFWRQTESIYQGGPPDVVREVSEHLRMKWNRLWESAEERPQGRYLPIEQAERWADSRFQAPCPGWPAARHHAPDLLWDAGDVESLQSGDSQAILGELHPGVNPLSTLSVLAHCDVRDELQQDWNQDFPAALISPIPGEEFARSTIDARLANDHWHLDLGGNFSSELPAHRVLRVADFDVVRRGNQLVAVHVTRPLTFDLLGVFERRIILHAATAFSLWDGCATSPRRYLGNLLVQRRQWALEAANTLDFVRRGNWDGLQEWRSGLGIPDRVFVRLPQETKPVYIDFGSGLSTDWFTRLAANSSAIRISEMLPGPDGLWLCDGKGNRYTSEVRMIAVDPMEYDSELVWRDSSRTILGEHEAARSTDMCEIR